ncbi:hypothetical protein [Acidicapsa ligni]|uniref:hypothetical protein n=1 Tax=Acidicapsa ligni TaxID=542300 RepID=UPI0021DFCEEC|nr:hypothetical protein [Acidicapsa ligni]
MISYRRFVVSSLLLASVVLCGLNVAAHAQDDTSKRGRKYKAPPPTAKFEVTVVRASTGKPVENASVIFHPLEDGRNNGNMELKTNDEGKASLDLLSIGKSVRLQVIAQGFQTFGEDYLVDKDKMAVEIKLNRPAKQYSIYKKSEGSAPDKDKPADPNAKPEVAPPDAGTAPAPDAPKDGAPATAPSDAKPQDTTSPK